MAGSETHPLFPRALLLAGMAIPVLYFLAQAGALYVNPRFDLLRQQPSELGCCSAHLPTIANAGFLLTGGAAILAAIGHLSVKTRTGRTSFIAALSGLCLAVFGVAMAMSGMFPLPLHYGFGLYAAGLLVPLLGGFAMTRTADRVICFAAFAVTVAIAALASGVGGVASEGNAGAFARAASLVLFPAIAFQSWRLFAVLPQRG